MRTRFRDESKVGRYALPKAADSISEVKKSAVSHFAVPTQRCRRRRKELLRHSEARKQMFRPLSPQHNCYILFVDRDLFASRRRCSYGSNRQIVQLLRNDDESIPKRVTRRVEQNIFCRYARSTASGHHVKPTGCIRSHRCSQVNPDFVA